MHASCTCANLCLQPGNGLQRIPCGERLGLTWPGLTRLGPGEWRPVGRPDYLRQCAEMSLRRLNVETIDLYQLHRIDPQVALEDQLGVFVELLQAGKIRQVGLSEVSVEQLEAARKIVPIATVQNLYNVGARDSEALAQYSTEHGIGFIPWFPVASGDTARPGGPLDTIAQRTGHTPAQLSLAWLLRRSPVMLPIPGTKSLDHLEENCAAAQIELDDATYEELSAVAAP